MINFQFGGCMEVVRSLVFIFLLFPVVLKIAKGNPWSACIFVQEETNFTTFEEEMQGLENYGEFCETFKISVLFVFS